MKGDNGGGLRLKVEGAGGARASFCASTDEEDECPRCDDVEPGDLKDA